MVPMVRCARGWVARMRRTNCSLNKLSAALAARIATAVFDVSLDRWARPGRWTAEMTPPGPVITVGTRRPAVTTA